MSDDELKALVANIAVSQDRTDELLQTVTARLDKLAVSQDRTDELLQTVTARLDKLAASQDRTDAQLAKTDAKLNRLAEMYGGVGNNQGAVAEEFYHNSLKANPVLDGERFDFLQRNTERSGNGLANEFDLLLVNGRTVCVVEVKYKAHENDLTNLLAVKAVNFPRLFPEYAGHEQRFALAAFHIHDRLRQAALKRGVTVLQRKGDIIESTAA